MLVSELIDQLSKIDQSLEVVILDGSNGGGNPRTINLGPYVEDPEKIPPFAQRDFSDIDTVFPGKIVIMGYGFY